MEQDCWIKLGTIHGELAQKIWDIEKAIGVIAFEQRIVEGRMVLDVFTDGHELHRYKTCQTIPIIKGGNNRNG